jgi:hypothetical protein
MSEPRKVWVVFEATEEELRIMLNDPHAILPTQDSAIRAALARKPDEEPWEGVPIVNQNACEVFNDSFARFMDRNRTGRKRVLVVPLPEEK